MAAGPGVGPEGNPAYQPRPARAAHGRPRAGLTPSPRTPAAIAAGDPPAVKSAYTAKLYAAAPYLKQDRAVFKVATPPGHPGVHPDPQPVADHDLVRAQREPTVTWRCPYERRGG